MSKNTGAIVAALVWYTLGAVCLWQATKTGLFVYSLGAVMGIFTATVDLILGREP